MKRVILAVSLFLTMARAQLDLSSQPNPMNPGCSVCGVGMTVTTPDNIWTPPIPGFDPVACGVLELAGLTGFIDAGSCAALASLITADCNCADGEATLPPGTEAPATAAPITPAPVTAAPVTPAPVTPAPVTPAPVTPAPVTPAPVTPAPVPGTPVTAAPVTAAPVTTAPVTASPISSVFPPGSPGFPVCPICGEGRTVTNRAGAFSAPGQPDRECGAVQDGGLLGFISPANCIGIQSIPALTEPCNCQDGEPVVGEGPDTPAPVTPAPVTPAPVTPAPVTSAPVTPAPVPVTPAPVTPAPVDIPNPIGPPTQQINLSIFEILRDNPPVSTFARLIAAVGLGPALTRAAGPYTIFAPSNSAFSRANLRFASLGHLRYVVREHIVPGIFLVPDIPPILRNVNGNLIFVRGNELNGGKSIIVQQNVVGTNGAIQVVDRILRNFSPSNFAIPDQKPSSKPSRKPSTMRSMGGMGGMRALRHVRR